MPGRPSARPDARLQEPAVRAFPYTGERAPFRRALTAVGTLILVAVPVALLLLQLVLPQPLAVLVDGCLAGVTIALLVAAASPLFTTHRLRGDVLQVRYGVLLQGDIPVRTIAATRIVRRPVGILEPLLPAVHADRAAAVFGPEGQVLLELVEPCRLRVGLRFTAVRELTLTVDDPGRLRARLAV
jgi:hypothetical protein